MVAVSFIGLRQGLAVQLEQFPFLSLASDESIKQALRLMNRPVAEAILLRAVLVERRKH
jgi:hypothetical protein